MPEPLTKLERRILDYLIDYLRRNTYQPSIREIGRRFNIKSTKTVSEHLQSLADKGWIERDPSRSRGVRLLGLDLTTETVPVPYYRDLAAIAAAVAADDSFELDRRLANGGGGSLFLSMNGEGMESAGIRSGDLLLVEPVMEEELEDGDVVVVHLDGACTLGRFRERGGQRMLDLADPAYAPLPLHERGDLVFVGRVSAIFRRFRVPRLAAASAAGERANGDPIP
ncbi:MAG TPA: transcriptional repressor LexA [Longimicrobiales bacterium]